MPCLVENKRPGHVEPKEYVSTAMPILGNTCDWATIRPGISTKEE
jgi:hypothetical protein